MQIRYQKLNPQAHPPRQSTFGAAGYDLTCISKTVDDEHKCIIYGTGLALEIPQGYVGLLFPRSSVYKTSQFLANCIGVIDSDYRGEIKAIFRSWKNNSAEYSIGDRIVQLIIMQIPTLTFLETAHLTPTERGSQGLGSTGQ
ncbi:MAG: dUTP diphosphatase [Desulfovibrio sp.]|nr:dUTP diphosphatase [Desulfovibrio sp.]